MIKFNATIEFLAGQRAALVELHTLSGDWAGIYRVESRHQSDLYEIGYTRASQEAAIKGGRLETYRVVKVEDFAEFASHCSSRMEISPIRRPANALNVEIGTPMVRCINKRPSHWTDAMTSIRWLRSGGDALVFGVCTRQCPLL